MPCCRPRSTWWKSAVPRAATACAQSARAVWCCPARPPRAPLPGRVHPGPQPSTPSLATTLSCLTALVGAIPTLRRLWCQTHPPFPVAAHRARGRHRTAVAQTGTPLELPNPMANPMLLRWMTFRKRGRLREACPS